MRSHEERVAAVKQRVALINHRKRQNRARLLALSSVAACLAVIVGVSFAMPGISESLVAGNDTEYEAAASAFGGSAAAGYIIIGLLAFVLGVCVTILCFAIRDYQEKEKDKDKETGCGNDRIH